MTKCLVWAVFLGGHYIRSLLFVSTDAVETF